MATASLALLLAAIVLALGITLVSVAPQVRLLAGVAVVPIVGLGALFLFLERRRARWGFAGAAVLGLVGVGLRLVVNARPQLEVGGGLPLPVTIVYVALGLLVAVASGLAYRQSRYP